MIKVQDLGVHTGATTGTAMRTPDESLTVQVTAVGGAATVVIEGSNDGTNYLTIGTVTLAGAGSDGFAFKAPWGMIRSRCTSLGGTSATAYIAYFPSTSVSQGA